MRLMIIQRSVFWVVGLLACTATATAQSPGWAEAMFEEKNHDFGVIARGAEATYRFKITNNSNQQVHIANTRTTCGCTAARPSRDLLESGETAYIEVSMNTRKFTRKKDSNLIVTFDAPSYAEVRLPISAYIRTDVVLTPGMVNFGPVAKGTASQKKIDIAYAGREDWKILKVETQNPNITAKAVEKERNAGRVKYDLIVDLKGDAPVGDLRSQLFLITDDTNSPRVPVLIEGRVEAEITITPRAVSFGVLTAGGNKKTVNVVLRGRKPFTIEKIESESGNAAYQVQLPTTTKPVHVLPLSFVPSNKPGKFAETFTVTIKGMPEPIQFTARGEIAAATAEK